MRHPKSRLLAKELLDHGSIHTTLARAKSLRIFIEKLITRAKKGKESDRRFVLAALSDRVLVKRLMEDAKTRFVTRSSGYTRIVKLGPRTGDATEMVIFSFVDAPRVKTEGAEKKKVYEKRDKTNKSK